MFDRIIHFSIHHKLLIGFLVVLLVAWGGYALTQLPIDALPDITNNQVQVNTLSPALATQEIEQTVTVPIELAMANVPGAIEVRSISRFGLSNVTIVFREDVDPYRARQMVSEKLQEAIQQIPPGSGTPELAPISTGLGEIYQYVLHPAPGYERQFSPMDLRTLQDWTVRRQLAGIPGVAEINGFGGYRKQYEVAVNPQRLRQVGITMSELLTALQGNNRNTGGAYIEKGPRTYFIRGLGLVKSLNDVARTVVVVRGRTPVLVRDVAQVRFGSAVRYGAMTRNNEGEVVGGVILMLKGENSNQVVSRVKERMAQVQRSLPKGVIIEPFLDRSDLISRAIHTVTKNLEEGALIVLFVLILFLGNWRAGLVVASVIPLAMLFAISLMNLFGVSGNLLSLGAIDFGLIVDGAVIIVEAIVSRVAHGRPAGSPELTRDEMNAAVYESASRIRHSASFGEIIILMVYLPILALAGIEGKMFRPMAETVAFAIVGALLLSLTYVPMMAALALSRKADTKETFSDKLMARVQRSYAPLLARALRHRSLVLGLSGVLLVGAYLLFRTLGGEFIPTLDEGDLAIEMRMPNGTALGQTVAATGQVGAILRRQFPEVTGVVSRIGVADIPTDPDPIEVAMVTILLKPRAEWTSAATRDELATKMKEALEVLPGVDYQFSQPIQLRFNELISGARQDVAVKIYGEDLARLAALGQQAAALIATVPGAQDVAAERTAGLPQITVNFNRDRLAQYGLPVSEVADVLATGFSGATAGTVYEGAKRFDLVLRLDSAHRTSIDDVRALPVALADTNQVPLSEVAQIELKDGPAQISHEDGKRRITVGLNARGRDVQSVVQDIQRVLAQKLPLPPGYYLTYGGQFQNLVEAQQRLSIAVPVALALIFSLLFFTFSSLKESLLIFTAIPLSAIGGVVALWARGLPFSVSAGIGFIALFGVAVLNGIVLIGEFNRLEAEGVHDVLERVRLGTAARLRPVVMTAAVASLGFLPMALSNTAGAEVQRPLATVVIGGLVTATLLTLVVLPVLYSLFLKGGRGTPPAPTPAEDAAVPPAPGGGLAAGGMVLLLVVGSALLAQPAGAQTLPSAPAAATPLTLDAALGQALQRNPGLQSATYSVQQQQALLGTALEPGRTSLSYGYEDNAALPGNKTYGVGQSLEFPTVYARQAQALRQQVTLSERSRALTQASLRRDVQAAYLQLAYGLARLRLLTNQDSLYRDFARAAAVRYKLGEASYLEQVSAAARAREVEVARRQAEADRRIFERELQRVLGAPQLVALPANALVRLPRPPALADTAQGRDNPTIALSQQQLVVAQAQQRVLKARNLPDFSAYYNRQTQAGEGGFYGYGVGLNVPLFARAQRSRTQAGALAIKVAEADLANARNNVQAALAQQVQQVEKADEALRYLESAGLQQAREIVRVAKKSYRAGEVGYVEYVAALTQAYGIRGQYLEALNQYNQSIITLTYLLGAN
ncbi:CusA/CzcA family heavy metal efflux RND transporter [Hymenobacter ginsengisoli]|uniref:CusA/CzcA family heavy metal efflux RND transporter n=1 Tax=Hymenobacter ginsengisoli TaxID=1051626 RepID=A0ABP8QIB6_9BACT|nr:MULTISPECIES: CusA/CzcA family heavy metal efflux RND transporter [unclassified Hymenobacter]MBO2029870.1 CusA/CzcA family heavy metal efflux RND transporter [Hymenobacter sp. BT559]